MCAVTIIGLKMKTGLEYGPQLQAILSNYSCTIKTRIGLHETTENKCEGYGIVLLHITDENTVKYLQNDILDVDGIEMQVMKFN